MKDILTRYRDWRSRQKEGRIAKWAIKRQKEKSNYVAGYALFWCLYMTVLLTLVTYLFEEKPTDIASVTIRLILFFFAGLVVGHFTWNAREKEYLNAIIPKQSIHQSPTATNL